MRKLVCLAFVVSSLAPFAAAGQVVPMTERPLVLPEGTGEFAVDLLLGLNKGAAGKTFGLATGLASDRYPGVSLAYGVSKRIELGAAFALVYSKDPQYSVGRRLPGWPPFIGSGTGGTTLVGPVYIWGKLAVAPPLALEVGLVLPGEQFMNNRAAIRLGVPFKWVFSPGLFSVHVRPDLLLGFAKKGYAANKDVQVSFYVDAGATLTLIPEVFLDLSLGYGQALSPSLADLRASTHTTEPAGTGYLPLSFTVGYTVLPQMDLSLGFTLANLTPGNGRKPADAKNLTLGGAYRF